MMANLSEFARRAKRLEIEWWHNGHGYLIRFDRPAIRRVVDLLERHAANDRLDWDEFYIFRSVLLTTEGKEQC